MKSIVLRHLRSVKPFLTLMGIVLLSIVFLQLILIGVMHKEIDEKLSQSARQQENIIQSRLENITSHLYSLVSIVNEEDKNTAFSEYIRSDNYLNQLNGIGAININENLIFGEPLPKSVKTYTAGAFRGEPGIFYIAPGWKENTDKGYKMGGEASLFIVVPIVYGDNVMGAIYGFISGSMLDNILFSENWLPDSLPLLISRDRHNFILPESASKEWHERIEHLRFIENESEISRLYSAIYHDLPTAARVSAKGEECYFSVMPLQSIKGWYAGLIIPAIEMRDRVIYIIIFTAGAYILLSILFIAVFVLLLKDEKKHSDELLNIAYIDRLTNLPKWEKIIIDKENDPQKENAALGIIDIDDFSAINEAMGTKYGDGLLKNIAATIRQSLRSNEIAARARDDCFLIYIYGQANMADRLTALLEFIIAAAAKSYSFSLTCGVAPLGENVTLGEALDRAMKAYRVAKEEYDENIGHSRIVIYDSDIAEKAEREKTLGLDFIVAMKRREFQVLLQPGRYLTKKGWAGSKLKLSWNHHIYGLIEDHAISKLPIDITSRVAFDYYKIDAACDILRRWLKDNRSIQPIAVPISRTTLIQPNLVQDILNILKLYEVMPEYIELEVSEKAFAAQAEIIADAVERLAKAHFSISIDEFGSGRQILPLLTRLPIKRLRVKKSHIVADGTEKFYELVSGIASLAQKLSLELIVSGIDTATERELLSETGATIVQGLCCSRPISVTEYETMIYNVDNT